MKHDMHAVSAMTRAEFQHEPDIALAMAEAAPVAICRHGRPEAWLVSADLFAELVETSQYARLLAVAARRNGRSAP